MPRKQRNPKERRGPAAEVSRAMYTLLLYEDFHAAKACAEEDGDENVWGLLLFDQEKYPQIWREIEAEAIREWVDVYPGTRPASWWKWSAPDLRHVYGLFTVCVGANRCHATGIPYGRPDDWADPPMVESQATFLDRHGLWLDGERERVPAEAFSDEQPFSWTLTKSNRGPNRMAFESERP